MTRQEWYFKFRAEGNSPTFAWYRAKLYWLHQVPKDWGLNLAEWKNYIRIECEQMP